MSPPTATVTNQSRSVAVRWNGAIFGKSWPTSHRIGIIKMPGWSARRPATAPAGDGPGRRSVSENSRVKAFSLSKMPLSAQH
jgi:hypothetical protein